MDELSEFAPTIALCLMLGLVRPIISDSISYRLYAEELSHIVRTYRIGFVVVGLVANIVG